MNIQRIKIEELKHADYNPRKTLQPNDIEYQKIKKSIEHFGYVDPIIINKDNTIIGGHQRATVMKDLGYKEVECVVVDLSKEDEKALNVALNKISGEWDISKLGVLLEELNTVGVMELTGFDTEEYTKMLDKSKARFRIEPASAMIISHTLARLNNTELDINSHIMDKGYSF